MKKQKPLTKSDQPAQLKWTKSEKQTAILKEDLKVNSLVGMGDTKIYAKDTVNIDNVDNLAEILKADVAIGEKDVKISYNKVCIKQ